MKHDYIFLLGREPELSLAELRSVFGEVEHFSEFALITEEESRVVDMANGLGGSIKIGKILSKNIKKQDLLETIVSRIKEKIVVGKKFRIAIDTFVPAFSSLVFKVKDSLKEDGFSLRVVQHEGGRIKTATTIHEKLLSQGAEFMLISSSSREGYILAETVWVQDIDAYTKRDMDRERSMVVGMMPPKIAQIMINLATKGDRDLQIWDSFCGLGTTIIEAWSSGYKKLIASDISEEMVKVTKLNTEKIGGQCIVFCHDSREIDTYTLHEKTVIVTEGMLGKNFSSATINHAHVMQERAHLSALYKDFLNSAWNNTSVETIVLCLPFWNSGKDVFFMPSISELDSQWSLDPLCKGKKRYLQHMRPGQCVGREIVALSRAK